MEWDIWEPRPVSAHTRSGTYSDGKSVFVLACEVGTVALPSFLPLQPGADRLRMPVTERIPSSRLSPWWRSIRQSAKRGR
jgi:hypothetical protein